MNNAQKLVVAHVVVSVIVLGVLTYIYVLYLALNTSSVQTSLIRRHA